MKRIYFLGPCPDTLTVGCEKNNDIRNKNPEIMTSTSTMTQELGDLTGVGPGKTIATPGKNTEGFRKP